MGKVFRKNGLKALVCVTVLFVGLSVPLPQYGSVGNILSDKLLSPLQRAVSGSTEKGDGSGKSFEQLENETSELRNENRRLNDMLIDYYSIKSENDELRRFYDIKAGDRSLTLVSAKVIGRERTDGFCVLTLDKGRHDGIEHDNIVITENGIVGRVSETGDMSCRVVTILSPEVKIGAEIKRTGDGGMLSGRPSLSDEGLCELRELPSQSACVSGDIVVTSGRAGVYPANIKIGTVKEKQYDPVTALPTVVIQPFESIKDVSSVAVITDFKGKGELSSEKP